MNNVISTRDVITRFPKIVSSLPSIYKGLKVSKKRADKTAVGIAQCFEKCVEENSNGVALRFEQEEYTYHELNRQVNKASGLLLDYGILKGDCVAVQVENRTEMLVLVLACAKVGAVCAMLNTSQKGNVLKHSIDLVSPRLIVIGQECLDNYLSIRPSISVADSHHILVEDTAVDCSLPSLVKGWRNFKEIESFSDRFSATSIDPEDPCFYVYTSGTTGLPKAVVFNHGRFMKAYGAFGYGSVRLTEEDRMYVPLPFYHSTAMAVCWGAVLASNSCLVLSRKFSATKFWQDVEEHKATAFGYVGEVCRYLMNQPQLDKDINNRVRVIVGNGMRPSIWGEFKERFGIDRVMEFYASSEGNIGFTNVFNFENTVGFSPLPYAIVKYDKERELPYRNHFGEVERVEKGGVGLLIGKITDKTPFHGYSDPDKNKKCILKDVFKSGDAWFNTGDLMRDMGFKHAQFVDRTGDTFRWKGENVSTTEVEMQIEQLEWIDDSVVYGVEIPGTNGRAGMVSISSNKSIENIDFSLLYQQLSQALPHYAIPVFIRLNNNIQLTETFKHKKNHLKEEGFNLDQVKDPVLVCMPRTKTYVPMEQGLFSEINNGAFV